MKTVLPFKAKPKQDTMLVGDEKCGILEMPTYGSLLWHERQAVREADSGFNMFKEAALAAGAIAKAEDRTDLLKIQQEVINLLQLSMGLSVNVTEEGVRLRVEHAPVINDLMDRIIAWNDRRQLAAVTALVQNRLEGFADWDEVMVQRHITCDLMVYLYDFFALEESNQSRAQDDERNEVDEEELVGKSSEASGKNPPNQTGDTSSGDSSSSIPVVVTSTGNDSEASQSSESSTPTPTEKPKNDKTTT